MDYKLFVGQQRLPGERGASVGADCDSFNFQDLLHAQ